MGEHRGQKMDDEERLMEMGWRAPKRGWMCWGDVLGKVKGVRSTSRLGQSFLLRESFIQSQTPIVLGQ